MESTDDFCL
jgi:hypothetical protein